MIEAVSGLTTPGAISVEKLEAQFPREVVAYIDVPTDFDGQILIACHEPGPQLPNPVSTLTRREYQCLLLVAQGMSNKDIALSLPSHPRYMQHTSASTVRSHLHKVYEKLDVIDRSYASLFIPMPASQIREFDEIYSDKLAALPRRQTEVFERMADGLTLQQIALEMTVAATTVRSHVNKIAPALGLDNGFRDISGQIRRLGAAQRNWLEFGMITERSATVLQPHVKQVLKAVARAKHIINIDNPSVMHTISNESLLAELEEGEFMPAGNIKRSELDLGGLVAAILFKRSETAEHMRRKPAQPIAREIIRREVGIFLAARGSS